MEVSAELQTLTILSNRKSLNINCIEGWMASQNSSGCGGSEKNYE
jgi:hypothetical protein